VDQAVAHGDPGYRAQVIRETLRLHPPVSFLGREALADDELGGFPIPKGSVIVICPFATHRRADLWHEPERFDPSRFDPEVESRRPSCAFIPFAAGPRGCIGAHFATMEMAAALAKLTPELRLSLADPRPIRALPLISMRPERAMRMRVSVRRPISLAV
jgi:cytochrome P450